MDKLPKTSRNTIDSIKKIKDSVIQQGLLADSGIHKTEDDVQDVTVAKMGATVVTIENEEWRDKNGKNHYGIGVLGYFHSWEQGFSDVKFRFASRESVEKRDGSLKLKPDEVLNEWAEHPLSKKGYSVPKNGGYTVLENGFLILLSKSGLFKGGGGWESARENRLKWIREIQRNEQLKEEIDTLYTKERMAREGQLQRGLLLQEMLEYTRKIQERAGALEGDVTKYNKQRDSMLAELESVGLENEHLKVRMKSKIADLDNAIHDILTFVHTNVANDSIRAMNTDIPQISDHEKRYYAQDWKKKGIVKDDESEQVKRAYGELKQRYEQLANEYQKMRNIHGNSQRSSGRSSISPDGQRNNESGDGNSQKGLENSKENNNQSEGDSGVSGDDEGTGDSGAKSLKKKLSRE